MKTILEWLFPQQGAASIRIAATFSFWNKYWHQAKQRSWIKLLCNKSHLFGELRNNESLAHLCNVVNLLKSKSTFKKCKVHLYEFSKCIHTFWKFDAQPNDCHRALRIHLLSIWLESCMRKTLSIGNIFSYFRIPLSTEALEGWRKSDLPLWYPECCHKPCGSQRFYHASGL